LAGSSVVSVRCLVLAITVGFELGVIAVWFLSTGRFV
jgi:hypothetical protein